MDKDKDLITTAKDIFLTDVDEELLKENTEIINAWETELTSSENYLDWQGHDITRHISQQAKESYRAASAQLSFTRDLTEAQRNKLYATQDACSFILSLTEKDVKTTIFSLREDIKRGIQNFS